MRVWSKDMISQCVKDRNEAFASGDKDKIIAYCKKYEIAIPEDENIFWAGVHKAICNMFLSNNTSITLEQYTKSADWLAEHGSTPSMFGGDL